MLSAVIINIFQRFEIVCRRQLILTIKSYVIQTKRNEAKARNIKHVRKIRTMFTCLQDWKCVQEREEGKQEEKEKIFA